MKIFVYGTLKRGYGNNSLLKEAEFVKEATVAGYELYDSGFPVANPKQASVVLGEIWDIGDNERTLQRLDFLESNGRMYNRTEVTTQCGEQVSMYVGVPSFWRDFQGMRHCHIENGIDTQIHWWER